MIHDKDVMDPTMANIVIEVMERKIKFTIHHLLKRKHNIVRVSANISLLQI